MSYDPAAHEWALNSPLRDDLRPTEEIIALALKESDENKRCDLVSLLHLRATEEVYEKALRLCQSSDPNERKLGADVFGKLCRYGMFDKNHEEDCMKALLGMLETEHEADVLYAILCALGHYQLTAEDLNSFLSFKTHSDADVRHAVASGLSDYSSAEAIQTVIELMSDEAATVRDWATFELGSQMEARDSEEIRNALAARLGDPDGATRVEAIKGLAVRKDKRALEPLKCELATADDEFEVDLIGAAEESGDPQLHPLLIKLRSVLPEDEMPYLERAIAACTPIK